MNKIILLFTAAFLIMSSGIIKAQERNYSYQVTSPCPENGIPVTKIDGVFTSSTNVKTNPEAGADCRPSMEKTAYAEHFIILRGTLNRIAVRLSGENIRLDFYNRYYYPGEPCANLLASVFPSDWDTLTNLSEFPILMMVVSSTSPIIDSLQYSIEFEDETGLIPEKCLFSCEQKKDVLNLSFPYQDLDIQISETYQLKEKAYIVEHGCMQIGQKEHKFTTSDATFTIFSTFFLKPQIVETSFNLEPLELACSSEKPSLSSILAHLSATNPPEKIAEFTRLTEFLSKTICNPSIINKTYHFDGLENLNKKETDTFELKYGIVNWCAGKVIEGKQVFYIKRSETPADTFSMELSAIANPLTCQYKLKFPIPPGYNGCFGENVHYTIQGNAPVLMVGSGYQSDLSPGSYSFEYKVYDCCSAEPLFFYLNIQILEPPMTITPPQPISLSNQSMVIPGRLFTDGIVDPCYLTKSTVVESSSCGEVVENRITICCDDLVYQNDTTVAQNIVQTEIEVVRDRSHDGIFGNSTDDTIRVEINMLMYDDIHGIVCPNDAFLPCTTTDLSPEVTGMAHVLATCFNTYKPRYNDVIEFIQADKSLVTRTFEFFGYQSVHRCIQKIELDCTVGSEDVSKGQGKPEIMPNPFQESPVISFWSDTDSFTRFSVLNDKGQRISTFEANITAGKNSVQLPASLFHNTGIYIVDFMVNGKQQTARLVKIE